MVADQLRARILRGELPDGSHLPKEEDLRGLFGVGKPAMREAMRILEEEGLVSVLRGNRGGAVVHSPKASGVAYSLGHFLTARSVTTEDVAVALREIEPVCAGLCARRSDRRRNVVPELRRLVDESPSDALDTAQLSALSRRFHEELVAACGNQTLIVMVGALEVLWSSHVRNSTVNTDGEARVTGTLAHHRQSMEEHRRIVDCIEAGDPDGARVAVIDHLARVQKQQTTANQVRPVDSSILKGVL